MNKITRKTTLSDTIEFDDLLNDFVEDSMSEHRRGSNFYTKSIVEINEKEFPDLPRELDGFWETNQYIADTEYGTDWSEIRELNRVVSIKKKVITEEWKLVSEMTGKVEEETVEVPVSYRAELLRRAEELSALQAAGVDNWSGYSYAMELLKEAQSL